MSIRIVDVFPFFNELDVLEVRLNELDKVVDHWVIGECLETYGGAKKPLYLRDALGQERFKKFVPRITHYVIPALQPVLKYTLHQSVNGVTVADIRTQGRLREADMRNQLVRPLRDLGLQNTDIISFGDCDEIPSANAVEWYAHGGSRLIGDSARLKQASYYYNVDCYVDYGRDVCSRARVGTYGALKAAGTLYDFRMLGNKQVDYPAIERAGWHLSYFGGDLDKIKYKVDALNPFLKEYTLPPTPRQLLKDILERKDIHHRSTKFSELPETFAEVGPSLPEYLATRLDTTFKHFTAQGLREKYAHLL